MATNLIQHVSDTALWIAGYRAQESERNDAVFTDPLAKKLAGKRGLEMVKATPHTVRMAFAMVVRTIAIDRLIHIAIENGVDSVINLGAGLDTRPYRMSLPVNLRWTEVDFPHVIAYKNDVLKDETAACQLHRIAADLSNHDQRVSVLRTLGSQVKKALIVTEGVIAYLTNLQSEKLSRDLFAIPSFNYWIMDYAQGFLAENSYSKKLEKILVQTPFQFTEKYPLQFFGSHGWKIENNIFILDEADRIGRKLPLSFPYTIFMALFPKTLRSLGNKTYGYVMFGKK